MSKLLPNSEKVDRFVQGQLDLLKKCLVQFPECTTKKQELPEGLTEFCNVSRAETTTSAPNKNTYP